MPDQMERSRAVRCYIGEWQEGERKRELEAAAFMSIFHPEYKGKRLKAVLDSCKRKRRRKC